MAADIGPGTRLLCVRGDEFGPRVGSIYTCTEVHRPQGPATCAEHGVTVDCFGVNLKELPASTRYGYWWASCCFRPLGGELPAEIRACLNVEPTRVKEIA